MRRNFSPRGSGRGKPSITVAYAESAPLERLENKPQSSVRIIDAAIRESFFYAPKLGYDKNDVTISDGDEFALKIRVDVGDGEDRSVQAVLNSGIHAMTAALKRKKDPDVEYLKTAYEYALLLIKQMP